MTTVRHPGQRTLAMSCRYCRLPSDASGSLLPELRGSRGRQGDGVGFGLGRAACGPGHGQDPVRPVLLPGRRDARPELRISPWRPMTAWCSRTTPFCGLGRGRTSSPGPKGLFSTAPSPGCRWCSCGRAGQATLRFRRTIRARWSSLPIPAGRGFLVREHAFLAASDNIDFTWQNSPVWLADAKRQRHRVRVPDRPLHRPFRTAGKATGCSCSTARATCSSGTSRQASPSSSSPVPGFTQTPQSISASTPSTPLPAVPQMGQF